MTTIPVEEPRLVVPAPPASYSHTRDLAWLIIRLTAGGMLLVHGIFKLMPMAEERLHRHHRGLRRGQHGAPRDRARDRRRLYRVLSRDGGRGADLP